MSEISGQLRPYWLSGFLLLRLMLGKKITKLHLYLPVETLAHLLVGTDFVREERCLAIQLIAA
jgi:hypothetical protein